MLMAQAIRPPASPVGAVLSDTHSMNPGNGASSSILPGSEEGIGGRHSFPHTLAVTAVHNEWIENTAELDAGRYRFAPRRRAGDGAAKDGGAFAGAPTAITSARRRGTSSRSAPRKARSHSAGHSTERAIRPRIPKLGSRAQRCRRARRAATRRSPAPEWASRPAPSLSMKGISPGSGKLFWSSIGAGGKRTLQRPHGNLFLAMLQDENAACQGYRLRDLAHKLGRKD